MSTELQERTARERHVWSAVELYGGRPELVSPFRAGDWWVGSDGRRLIAYPAQGGDDPGLTPPNADRVAGWLAGEGHPAPLETTVEALRAWAGPVGDPCARCDGGELDGEPPCDWCEGEAVAPVWDWKGRQGLLCGKVINTRLLASMLEHAPDGSVHLSSLREYEKPILLRADGWRGLLAPLEAQHLPAAEGNEFSAPEEGA